MADSAVFAFLHHAAAFLLVAALMVELVLLRGELTAATARAILRMDAVYGVAAAAVLIVGFVRVLYTEKGAGYYFSNGPFLLKLALFAAAGILSVHPTRQFLTWRKVLREGRVPVLEPTRLSSVRRIVHIELALVFVIMLCAVLMARGVGMIAADM